MTSPSAVPEPLNDDALGLSAAARESFGFADDQFMELSTSGASIYSLPNILSEQSSTSSGRLAPSSGGSSNSSLRRVLLGTPGRATQDESSLPCSGVSLAVLGSLSRSVRRLSATSGCEETFADPNAWRDEGSGARSSPERGAGVQELSGPIAELRRQQSFTRRWPSGTSARSEPAPPPLPVGVDAAPVYSEDEQAGALQHNTAHARDNFVSTSGGPGSFSGTQVPAARNPAWGGVLQDSIVIASRNGGDQVGRSDGGGGGDADDVPSGKSPELKPRTKGSRPVRALLRSIGLGGARQQDGGSATQHRTGNTASGELEGLSVTSWSPDSSSREGARSTTSSVNTGGGNSPMLHGGGRAFRTRSAPTSAHPSEAGPKSDTEVASKSEGIRERIAHVFSRKGSKSSRKGGQPRDAEAMSDTPAGAEVGQFEFIPPDPRLGEAPPSGVYPEWYRSRSAPVGPTDSELKVEVIPDLLARAFPGTPLGTSNRSFDANQAFSPSAYEVDESNSSVPMPPRLGTNAAKEGLGASFDPNLSVKSLFDTSYSADPAQRDLEATGSWSGQRVENPHPTQSQAQAQQAQQQQSQAGTISSMGPGIADVSLPDTSAPPSPSHGAVDTGTGTTRDIRPGESVSMVEASGLVTRDSLVRTAAVLLNQEQLANDLSDLSVSAGSHRRGDDNPQGVDTSPAMDVSSDAPEAHDTPSLKASSLPSSVGISWLPDGPALGQGEEDDRHHPDSWLHGADGIDPTAGNRIHPLADAPAASHDPKVMNNGMWRLTPGGTATPAGHDAGLVSDLPWGPKTEALIPSRSDGRAPGGLLAGEIEALPELGPIPTANPMSGNGGRAQSADLDLLRRKAAAAGSHVEDRAYKGKGHASHFRGRSALRHVSLELGKASSSDISRSRGAPDFCRGIPSELIDPVLSSSSASTVPLGSNGPSVTSTDSPGGNMPWVKGSPVGAAFKKGSSQTAAPSPAAATSSAAVGIRPAIGASRDNPAGAAGPSGSRQTPSPWWTTRDSLPRRNKSSNRSSASANSTMIRPSSLPRAIPSASEASDSSSRLSMSLPKGSREEAKHDVSWSVLHAMIPTPGMGSKKGATPSGGDSSGAGLSSGESDTGRMGSSGAGERTDILGDSAAAIGGIGGSSDYDDEVLDSTGSSGGMGLLGPLGRRKAGGNSLGSSQEAPSPELMCKRRPSRILDIFGKHKKQCLDGADPGGNDPQVPSQDAFDYLREKLVMPSVEPALAKPQPSSSTTSGKTSTVSDTSKANRQAVAARRPRNRGRFMKSQQKWVTQVELKQEKIKNAAAASSGVGDGAGPGTGAVSGNAMVTVGSEMAGIEDRGAGAGRAEGSIANAAVTAAGSVGR